MDQKRERSLEKLNMSKYHIIYKLKFRPGEIQIPIDFEIEEEAIIVMDRLRLDPVYKNIIYSYIREA